MRLCRPNSLLSTSFGLLTPRGSQCLSRYSPLVISSGLSLRQGPSQVRPLSHEASGSAREATLDGRARLSRLWAPTGGIAASENEDSHAMLIRAGYLRQAHSGIFHMLPLGRRVQDKLESLIDKYMFQLGASKLSLSSISSEDLWSKSGRLFSAGSELFRFQDRKEGKYLLSPTHEEEITSLVDSAVQSYKDLPVRLYQISRKYRDERRPRQGLLRSREFIMKDLYTFDYSPVLALETYESVRQAYIQLFKELKLPFLVADADSGDIGGNLSHEFHFPTPIGEDNVISCSSCDYVANEELAESSFFTPCSFPENKMDPDLLKIWYGISKDKQTLLRVFYPRDDKIGGNEVNIYAIKPLVPDLDASVEDVFQVWQHTQPPAIEGDGKQNRRVLNLFDGRISSYDIRQHIKLQGDQQNTFLELPTSEKVTKKWQHINPITGKPLNLLRIKPGDGCPQCTKPTLRIQKAIELGHTFHLGTRYSKPMNATVSVPTELIDKSGQVEVVPLEAGTKNIPNTQQVYMQMGCHGIGVSRIIGAVADTLADKKGLNWPRVMAPFEVVIVATKNAEDGALTVYDTLASKESKTGVAESKSERELDLILDDRKQSFPWKMMDADLVGYPIIVLVGKRWLAEQVVEVQCRRLSYKEDHALGDLKGVIEGLLEQL